MFGDIGPLIPNLLNPVKREVKVKLMMTAEKM